MAFEIRPIDAAFDLLVDGRIILRQRHNNPVFSIAKGNVTQGAESRAVIFPDDTPWVHLWSGTSYPSGSNVIAAPIANPQYSIVRTAGLRACLPH